MRFTLSWLKQFLDTKASLDEISYTLTMIGLEVEKIEDKSKNLADFEVAEIIEASQHPNADKLKVCKVNTKTGILQIVCGAANARAGIKVVLAKVGVIIPSDNFKIKESQIRGVTSCGMMCSASELLLGKDSEGILELEDNAIVGDPVASYLGADDPVIHINITPNRADALGVYGIARDLAAADIGTLKELEIPKISEKFNTNYTISVKDSAACPLFAIREINGIQNKQSPKWLKDLLENIGINSISPIVDVTNYISYSFGQPMHAYDADKVHQGLKIELIDSETSILALNDKEYTLQNNDIVIKDLNEVHCLAGIIGGKNSSCSADTQKILLESAVFNNINVLYTGRRLGINTDSRYRFERLVDSEFSLKALDFATDLIIKICGGVASKVLYVEGEKPKIKHIKFPIEFLHSKTNIILGSDKISSILTKLGFICIDKELFIDIQVPSWRHDVSIKEDIVEEIVRIYGYNNIPQTPLPQTDIIKIIPDYKKRLSSIKRMLASIGYTEVVTWSFLDIEKAKFFTEIKDELTLENPISSDLDYMRPSILPNLIKLCHNNFNRSFKNLSLFEVGPVFKDTSDNIINHACGIRTGKTASKNSHNDQRSYDIFDIKADVVSVLDYLSLDIEKCRIISSAPHYYHPTKSATISLGKKILGYFGQVNPVVLKSFNIQEDIVAFELNIESIPFSKKKFGRKPDYIISNYQSTIRDYAFIVDNSLPASELLDFIRNVDNSLIKDVELFDVYIGDKIEVSKKSVAISIKLQDYDKTLTEEDIAIVNDKIINGIKTKFNGILRDY